MKFRVYSITERVDQPAGMALRRTANDIVHNSIVAQSTAICIALLTQRKSIVNTSARVIFDTPLIQTHTIAVNRRHEQTRAIVVPQLAYTTARNSAASAPDRHTHTLKTTATPQAESIQLRAGHNIKSVFAHVNTCVSAHASTSSIIFRSWVYSFRTTGCVPDSVARVV